MKAVILIVSLCILLAGARAAVAGEYLSRLAIAGYLQPVQDAVRDGENVNDVDHWGWTPLLWSVYYGNTPVARWLLDNGADPNISTRASYGKFPPGTTPLMLAAAYGHHLAVEALLKKKADPNLTDSKGRKALDYAQEYDFEKCVALLKGR